MKKTGAKHRMLILGNGFDKACGLKSSFEDYYQNKIKDDAERFISNILNDGYLADYTFSFAAANNIWSILFSLQFHSDAKYRWNNVQNHERYVNAIYDLINDYSYISKGDHNLLHRLIIEGRINIRKLEPACIL